MTEGKELTKNDLHSEKANGGHAEDSFRSLSPAQIEAAEALSRGIPERVVCAKVGVGIQILRDWLNRPDFKTATDLMASGAIEHAAVVRGTAEILDKASVRAAERVTELMENAEKDEVQLRAAEGILDRTGHARKTIVQKTVVTIDAKAAQIIAETRRMLEKPAEEGEYEVLPSLERSED